RLHVGRVRTQAARWKSAYPGGTLEVCVPRRHAGSLRTQAARWKRAYAGGLTLEIRSHRGSLISLDLDALLKSLVAGEFQMDGVFARSDISDSGRSRPANLRTTRGPALIL